MRVLLSILLSISFSSNYAFSQESQNQEDAPTTPEFEDVFDEARVYRTTQYVSLTLGIEQDIKLPKVPDNIEFKGSFKKNTEASYSKELNMIRFRPSKEGFSTLTIHDKRNGKIVGEYRIDVKRSNLDKVVKEMKALLSDIEGIQFKIINGKVVVDGQILLPKDLNRIYGVVSQFGDQATSLVILSPIAQKKIAEYIARDINNPEIEVRAINDKIILQGWANDEGEKVKAEIIAKMYLPDIIVEAAEEKGIIKKRRPANDGVINLISIKDAPEAPPKKMVQLVMHFVELNKDYSKAFKFQFTPELSDGSQLQFQTGSSGNSAGGVISSITGIVTNLLPKLNWAKEHGHAKILESTSLIVEDGKKGNLNQTTSVPYKVIGNEGQSGTAFADIGLKSAITPRILGERSGSVAMDMEFSMSNLIGTTDQGPMSSSNNVTTSITVRDRQSAAVGGIIRNATSTGYNRLPSSVKNPIISLYASKEFQRKQSQFVVFITPVIKTSASAGSEQIKKKFRLRE